MSANLDLAGQELLKILEEERRRDSVMLVCSVLRFTNEILLMEKMLHQLIW